MRYVLIAIPLLIVAGFLHWTLPSRDIVRIVGTDVVRRDSGQGADAVSRDLRLINAAEPDGDSRVYRNDDTGWGWPPYFKFDSADLAARADNAISPESDPRWSVVTHYGWRVPFLSWFPNAVAIRPATGPDETLIPWFNIVVVAALAGLALAAWRSLRRLFGAD